MSSSNQTWSIDDSEVERLLERRSQQKRREVDDVQVPSSQPDSVRQSQASDWGSMNNSEFVEFVNSMRSDLVATQKDEEVSQEIPAVAVPTTSVKSANSVLFNSFDEKQLFAQLDKKAQPTEKEEFEFGDYASYFKNKGAKQQLQDQEYVEFLAKAQNKTFPKLFENCVIYVNGKTHPDINQLHKLIILYGGKFLAFLGAKGNATHIIAENLTPRKRIEFRNYKVVKPEWITESIAAGKKLPWGDYMLINNDYGQTKIGFKAKDADEAISQLSEITDPVETVDSSKHMTAKDPLFLDHFFGKSRLHHLSTWKMDLRTKFLQTAVETLKKRKLPKSAQSLVIHVDFDCFFATVSALKHNPPVDIHKYPVCVTHGSSGSDVASCNYMARSKGCKNGMWLGSAKKKCPELICLDYNFDAYEQVSQQLYETLLEFELDSILPVSVDEALLDVTSLSKKQDPVEIMKSIRKKVFDKTGCAVSCGCGSNVLLAKLSLRRAKPDGLFWIKPPEVSDFLAKLNFRDLPGIGYSINDKLQNEIGGELTLDRVRALSKDSLTRLFGIKTGTTVWEYSRGIDNTSIDILSDPDKFARKSLSIDVNWGIRFDTDLEVEEFLGRLAKVLNTRLADIKMVGSSFTLKLAVRSAGAPVDPAKFLGMGQCDFVSKSSRLGTDTRELGLLSSEAKYLWRVLGVKPKELRGVSVSMGRLVSDAKTRNQARLTSMLQNTSKRPKLPPPPPDSVGVAPSQINWDVVRELPEDIQREIKGELRRRDLESTPTKKRIRGKHDIGVMVSPHKRRVQSLTITPALVEARTKVWFQEIPVTRFDEIKEKLVEWVEYTIDDVDGPGAEDIDVFNEFMLSLLDTEQPLKYMDALQCLQLCLNDRLGRLGWEKWDILIRQLRGMMGEMDVNTLVYRF